MKLKILILGFMITVNCVHKHYHPINERHVKHVENQMVKKVKKEEVRNFNEDRHIQPSEPQKKSTTNQNQIQPPNVLHLWIYIFRGEVYTNRRKPTNFPGGYRVKYQKMTQKGVEVFIESKYDPKFIWSVLLPKQDGEYYLTAHRVY